MTRYTFRLKPDGPVEFEILAPSPTHALTAANNYFGHIPNFYAWFGPLCGEFCASYGVWD